METKDIRLTEADIKAITAVLAKDYRVELIPTKAGVKIIKLKREEIK